MNDQTESMVNPAENSLEKKMSEDKEEYTSGRMSDEHEHRRC